MNYIRKFNVFDWEHICNAVAQVSSKNYRMMRVIGCRDPYEVEDCSQVGYMGNLPVVQVALEKAVKEPVSEAALRRRCVRFTNALYDVTSLFYGDNYALNVVYAVDAGDEIIFYITYEMWCR